MANKEIEFSFGRLCFFCPKGRIHYFVNKIRASILQVFSGFLGLSSQVEGFIQVSDTGHVV
jgi:hypothetical protein